MCTQKDISVRVGDLLDHPEALETVVNWIDSQWFSFSGRSIVETRARFSEAIVRDRLPVTHVAHAGDRVLGVASLRARDSFDFLTGATPWICNVYVDSAARGRNVAGILCRSLEERARVLGFEEVFLATVMMENSLYHRRGFQEVSKVDANGDMNVVLMKKLSRDLESHCNE